MTSIRKQAEKKYSAQKERRRRKAALVWITGLPGSGKTTLARRVYSLIKGTRPCVLIDGDHVREIMGNDLGYDDEDRLKNAFRIVKLNKHLVDHGITVICSTVSLFQEIHEWNRRNLPSFVEVYIEAPMETLIQRDQKNMYSRALAGEMKNVRGVNQAFDIPLNPDIIVLNDKDMRSFLKQAEKIKKLIA